jgi:hypothetical protein
VDWENSSLDFIFQTVLKKYSSLIHGQPVLEATLDLRQSYNLFGAEVDHVRCDVFKAGFDFAGGYGSKGHVWLKEQADTIPFVEISTAKGCIRRWQLSLPLARSAKVRCHAQRLVHVGLHLGHFNIIRYCNRPQLVPQIHGFLRRVYVGMFGKIQTTSFEDQLSDRSCVSGAVFKFSPGRFKSFNCLADTKSLLILQPLVTPLCLQPVAACPELRVH